MDIIDPAGRRPVPVCTQDGTCDPLYLCGPVVSQHSLSSPLAERAFVFRMRVRHDASVTMDQREDELTVRQSMFRLTPACYDTSSTRPSSTEAPTLLGLLRGFFCGPAARQPIVGFVVRLTGAAAARYRVRYVCNWGTGQDGSVCSFNVPGHTLAWLRVWIESVS